MKIGIYRHFKWTIVEVIWVALDSETLEEVVVYNHPDAIKWKKENTMWIRPKKMFLETIERDWKTMPRFEYIWDKKYGEI